MRVIRAASELQAADRRVCIAIGVFDGVHLGHQEVLKGARRAAHSTGGVAVAVTFDRHPSAIVAPERTPPSIQTIPQKLRAIGTLGFDATLLLEFNDSLSKIPGETFVRNLASDFERLESISVGVGFTFGHKRSGDVILLKRLGAELGYRVDERVSLVSGGQVISSTRIREEIRSGHLAAAEAMMGRPYAIEGKVEYGDQVGRALGFPTANLNTVGSVLPPNGVYAVRLDRAQGVMNIGFRPSLAGIKPVLRVEVHLLDFEGDLYGQVLEVTPVVKLREELRFQSLDELRHQISQDIVSARHVLAA